MRVTLTKRLGQNKPGTVIDTTVTQARWMFERRVAVAADQPEHSEQPAGTEQSTGVGQQAIGDHASSDTPKTGRGRRGSKASAGTDEASTTASRHTP